VLPSTNRAFWKDKIGKNKPRSLDMLRGIKAGGHKLCSV